MCYTWKQERYLIWATAVCNHIISNLTLSQFRGVSCEYSLLWHQMRYNNSMLNTGISRADNAKVMGSFHLLATRVATLFRWEWDHFWFLFCSQMCATGNECILNLEPWILSLHRISKTSITCILARNQAYCCSIYVEHLNCHTSSNFVHMKCLFSLHDTRLLIYPHAKYSGEILANF